MEIDPHNLPKEAGILRQIVLQLLGVVEEQDRLLERVQHQLQQLLRQRYGPKRERIVLPNQSTGLMRRSTRTRRCWRSRPLRRAKMGSSQ